MLRVLPSWPYPKKTATADSDLKTAQDHGLDAVMQSLQELSGRRGLSDDLQKALASDFGELERLLKKLDQGEIHIAVFGRVSVGKSSLLNALIGDDKFAVSPLHGETREVTMANWSNVEHRGVFFLDTPGIDEINGEEREALAKRAAQRSDMILFVVEGDMTRTELDAVKELAAFQTPIVLVLNKADRYDVEQTESLMASLRAKTSEIIDQKNIVPVIAAAPDKDGKVIEIDLLRQRLWEILAKEGKTLAAVNAGLFADSLSNQINATILKTRQELANGIIRSYCVTKGVTVALNPVPLADLVAAAAVDATMVLHLSKAYDLPLTTNEASSLLTTILAQLAALMGSVWVVHLLSSALKLGTAGLSTVLTAGIQGAIAYYSTHVVGSVAQVYLSQGKSWGEKGPKRVIQDILDNLDRDSILAQAKEDIQLRLRKT